MSWPQSSPEHQSSANNGSQDRQPAMQRLYRTPSPTQKARISGIRDISTAECTPTTPDGASPTFFELDHLDHASSEIPDPKTPVSKRIRTSWHGLPSPTTPAYFTERPSQQSTTQPSDDERTEPVDDIWAGEKHDTRPSFSPITCHSDSTLVSSKITDSLDEEAPPISPPSARRSTRIQSKMKNQDKLDQTTKSMKTPKPTKPSKPSKSVKQNGSVLSPIASPPNLTQAEISDSPFEVPLSTSGELPIHLSTQWQLQYPPGGSTHPCYPWPTADPRLTFHAHHVPLNNGLPDVSYVPTLVLPVGWRRACWSGLYPVVFDPYQQAFKLTPIGPLPLTSEEVNQGGLQDYIPGGKAHPEFGLLPMLSILSDGSDSEVFNFEGVDWKLPWAQVEGDFTFEIVTTSPVDVPSTTPPPTPYYIEQRDNPDDVIDLEDAWRWLEEWDPSSTSVFKATPGKSWQGSGIPLTSRSIKQPIASLMSMTMADKDPEAEHYLVKQVRRDFCPLKSVATPVHVDITLLKGVEFTIVELLTYFPSHYQWRGATRRLVRAGLSSADVANFVNMTRSLPAGSLCVAGTVNGYLSWDRDDDGNRIRLELSADTATCYTAEHWSNIVWELADYPLLGLAVGLKDLPSGADAGPLTSLIQWCREQKRHKSMLSDVPTLLKEANIEPCLESGNGTDPDESVLARYSTALKKDRLRVLKDIRVLKEIKETEALREKRPKKRTFE
ncbi:hypothetical protein C7974DRAFT_394345 [Boeremia exigua]|uniref:uncharacterized protein n=1 Tax=Boeremia exigua TaxID=749465 RepID=UPI001E8DFB29|nr:uncharacterized protein C7974DRAFT_394345 [Boeremia exigua]KAH6629376.1 hypothetical protein C7974DRAFT_394345 [Boeremia exigua]